MQKRPQHARVVEAEIKWTLRLGSHQEKTAEVIEQILERRRAGAEDANAFSPCRTQERLEKGLRIRSHIRRVGLPQLHKYRNVQCGWILRFVLEYPLMPQARRWQKVRCRAFTRRVNHGKKGSPMMGQDMQSAFPFVGQRGRLFLQFRFETGRVHAR